MSKGLRIFMIVCAVMVAVGLALAGVGFLLGGTPNLPLNGHFLHWSTEEYKAVYSGESVEDEKALAAFSSVELRVGVSEVRFIESDQYRVEYAYDKGFGKTNVEVRNGTLYVEDKLKAKGLFPSVNGWDFPKNSKGLYVNVYFPAGTEFERIKIECNLGSADLRDMKIDSLTAELNLGSLYLSDVTAESAEFDLDLGDLEAKDLETHSMKAYLDLGSLEIAGSFSGITNVECSLGDIDIKTSLPKEEYNFDVDVDLGNFKLNDKKLGTPYETDGNAANTMELNCDMGDVRVECR